jgi:two-component system response regulator MtrA
MTAQKILIIEDDPAIGQSLLDGLKQHGFHGELCKTGSSGIAYAQKQSPHLVILDVRLPDGSGFDFCRQMRQLGLRQPIIMLTAQHDEVDKVLGLEMGADDYMTKPFSMRELVSRIRAQLRRAYGDYSSAESAVVVVNDLVLEQATGQVRRGDEILNLTPIEFRLLMYLARHRGQATSRAQIVEAVWGFAPDIESEKTVNVHIRRLREKIELKPDQPSLILTVPGIGYRLAK